MSRTTLAVLALAVAGAPGAARAQGPDPGCQTPDTVIVRGLVRVPYAQARAAVGLTRGEALSFPVIQRTVRDLFATGQFDDITSACEILDGGRAALAFRVVERPLLGSVDVRGPERVSANRIRDQVDLLLGQPVDPAKVAGSIARIDSVYEASGYYLARVTPETTTVGDRVGITFVVDEGRRLAISGVQVNGNRRLSAKEIVGALDTRPEGFLWWKKGEFDEEKFTADLGEKLPKLYAQRGFVDFQVVRDTLIVDRDRGKGLIRLDVEEGAQYTVGSFELAGNRHFTTADLRRFYPFDDGPTFTERALGLLRGRRFEKGVFDRDRWEQATGQVSEAYQNEGYIYARVQPVVERTVGPDSSSRVNLRWDIVEGSPALIRRVEILGNDFTAEACIRDQIFLVPGGVFNRNALIRSYQNIQNLGFFNSPLPPPDTRPTETGDVDIIFRLTEKRTGNVNFGASVGQGLGVGGFIGLDQPNLWGKCKRGSLQWQFGRFINDFNLTYTDPAIRLSRLSGTVTAYNSRLRYNIADVGRTTRTGGNLRIGLPVPGSFYTRVFVSYGAEAVRYGDDGLLGDVNSEFSNTRFFRSTLGLDLTRDTRVDLPFATEGALQSFGAQFNGGPLGGTAAFQRYTLESRSYTLLGQLGGRKPGSQPIKFPLGLTLRAGAVTGDAGPFFFNQEFALGGVQFGEMLRGYPEFSISPTGFVTGTSTFNAQRSSFGGSFFTGSVELGVRFNQQFYVSAFYDVGNVYRRARDFDPTRLFRGAGVGLSTVTPLGPLGLDWAYGFDRLDQFGRKDPQFQLHFRLGQIF
jgi:outer membrane protein insertion porin family